MPIVMAPSHICLTSVQGQADAAELASAGYATAFIERDRGIEPAKTPYLRCAAASHDFYFFTHPRSPSLECIQHSKELTGQRGPYQPLFSLQKPLFADALPAEPTVVTHAFGAAGFPANRWVSAGRQVEFHCSSHEGNAPMPAVALGVADLGASLAFWRDLMGLKLKERAASGAAPWALLELSGILPAWRIKFLLVEEAGPRAEPRYLDDSGWTCFSFVTKRMDESLAAAARAGTRHIGKPFVMKAGGKAPLISFFRGPDNELVELVEPRDSETKEAL